jgi:hypothetical protein
MDLDALAGVVAYKHTGDSVMTVTAAGTFFFNTKTSMS